MTDTASRPPRPRPALTEDNAFFFEGARQGKLLIQRCPALAAPPAPPGLCRVSLVRVGHGGGVGDGHHLQLRRRPPSPGPGLRLSATHRRGGAGRGHPAGGRCIGVAADAVGIGMPVAVEFVAVDDELTLPMFRPT